MMEQILYIKWETGYMNINMDRFFPCTKAKFNKLLKIIELDWQHRDELRETLKVYFQERIPNLPKEAEELRNKAATYRMKAADLKEQIKADRKERKKKGLAPDPFSRLEAEYESNIVQAQTAEREAKYLQQSKARFEEYLKLL